MANILVTGGAGFIGSHLVSALVKRGDTVCVLDDFSSGRKENLQGFGKVRIQQGDLRNASTVAKAVRDIHTIFHLAAFVSVPQSMSDPEKCFSVNVSGTIGLLEAARQAGVRKVVIASSTAVYGETDSFPTSEDTPLHPVSPYAVSKQVTEIYARLYTHKLGLPVTALRFFNVYGPRQRPDSDYAAAIPIFLRGLLQKKPLTIFGDGKQTRDFIFVKDVVEANMLAADAPVAGEPYNICTGKEISLLDLMEEISELTQSQSGVSPQIKFGPARSGDIYRSLGDPRKAEAAFGFQAHTSLSEGLKQTLDWIKSTLPSHA